MIRLSNNKTLRNSAGANILYRYIIFVKHSLNYIHYIFLINFSDLKDETT